MQQPYSPPLRTSPLPDLRKPPARTTRAALPRNGNIVGAEGWLARHRIKLVLSVLVCTALLSAGIHLMTPRLAQILANSLPGSWVRSSSEQVLRDLENNALMPSQRPLAEQEDLRDHFAALNPAPQGAPPYRLLFRHSRTGSTTLLTLPGGEIIITDQFLQSVPDPSERLALLCHELGHLYYRHALHDAIEHSLYWLASAALIGSSESSVRALVRGMNQTDYKLEHVLEADHYALSMLSNNGLPARILMEAIEHGQGPDDARLHEQASLSHHQHFDERMFALQNLQ